MVAVEPDYCHQCGAELVERAIHGRERPACPDCGHRHFRNAVPAVDVVVRDGTDVLLMEPAGGGPWELPGGHPEFDEEPLDAATRELGEETGVEAGTDDLALLSAVHSTHGERHYNVLTYVVDHGATDGSVTPGEEAARVTFWPVDRVLATPAETREVDRRVLRRLFDR
jgi:8-oxo-dGTP diphosphatase